MPPDRPRGTLSGTGASGSDLGSQAEAGEVGGGGGQQGTRRGVSNAKRREGLHWTTKPQIHQSCCMQREMAGGSWGRGDERTPPRSASAGRQEASVANFPGPAR